MRLLQENRAVCYVWLVLSLSELCCTSARGRRWCVSVVSIREVLKPMLRDILALAEPDVRKARDVVHEIA